ncbi:Dihydropteroate synthase-like protein [Cytidiella melzeri]|nr:Dihydropteroate synthase-like protein [Cytidiella melzeri]
MLGPHQKTKERTSAHDVIRVKNILLTTSFTDGAQWAASTKPKLQPAYVVLTIHHSIAEVAATDNLELTINYSTVCKTIIEAANARPFTSSEDFLHHALDKCFAEHSQVHSAELQVLRPRALLQPASTAVLASGTRGLSHSIQHYSITGLECSTIVGVNDCEREQTQLVCFDITWTLKDSALIASTPFPIRKLSEVVKAAVLETKYLTLEALVSSVAQIVLAFDTSISSTTVCGGKPNALSSAEAPEVEITRTAADYVIGSPAVPGSVTESGSHQVTIAVGSNIGDRFANIEYALRLLENPRKELKEDSTDAFVTILDTSFLYETKPMYVLDQPKFANCACLVETNIAPVPLLAFLKDIEHAVGRVKSIRNGPRAIDLDIVTYDDMVLDTRGETVRNTLDNLEGHLVIPHPRLHEREFVLRPLADIIPDYRHPISNRPIHVLLEEVMASQALNTPVMDKVIPFPHTSSAPFVRINDIVIYSTATYWIYPSVPSLTTPQKTYIMAILNATPDSFSDGSVHNTVPAGLSYVSQAIESGADIIDVGGYSTRPGAALVSTEVETDRVTAMITAIRSNYSSLRSVRSAPGNSNTPLVSVDTFRWEVAEAALKAGANCINDVYAFTGPTYPVTEESFEHLAKMRRLASSLAVPVILMHSRGDASANKDYSSYANFADSRGRGAVVEAVKVELGQKVDRIVKGKGGLRRWLVIVDPGIGFSKTPAGNLEILRDSGSIVRPSAPGLPRNVLAGFPILVGPSRKSFLGALLGVPSGTYKGRRTEPKERGWATAATVACAVQQRANVVRVHDVLEMGDVVRVCGWLW